MEASEATEGRCTGNIFEDNYVNNAHYGVYMREADHNRYIGNTFIDTKENEWVDNLGLLWKVSGIDHGDGVTDTNIQFFLSILEELIMGSEGAKGRRSRPHRVVAKSQ